MDNGFEFVGCVNIVIVKANIAGWDIQKLLVDEGSVTSLFKC